MAGESWFRYSVTRPYPFRWFTPLVVVGFVVFLVLFSLLNTVALGFEYVPRTTTDPNATTASSSPWSRWVPPVCEDAQLRVGDSLTTNNSALSYQLTDIWTANDSSLMSEKTYSLPSFTYHNSPLASCNVSAVEMDFSSLDRTATQQAYSEWGIVVRSYITCFLTDVVSGPTYVNLTQEYDYVPPSVSLSSMYEFLGTNFQTRSLLDRASLYWGESLMSMYWASVSSDFATLRADDTANDLSAIRTGVVAFTPTGEPNITSLDFFRTDYRFFVDQGQAGNTTIISPSTPDTSLAALAGTDIDTLAKAAYATVLTDLGVPLAAGLSNILQDPDLLALFTANFSSTRHNLANAYPGPATQRYGTLTPFSGPLTLTPSVLRTTYLCRIPHLKPTGTLLVQLVVADGALLALLWLLFRGAVGAFALRHVRDRDACLGCRSSSSSSSLSAQDSAREIEVRARTLSAAAAAQVVEGGGEEMTRLRGRSGNDEFRDRDHEEVERSVSRQRLIHEHEGV